ncbi:MAG: MATE family efflux transporter [Oscillospiraceae bacterium]|nr:MATE family efflux transporter [Oscillospiraceae bacterium]
MNGRSMTEGTPWKHILRFALPVLAGSLLQQLYNTADTIIVGNFSGEDALSAVGTTTSLTFMFLAFAMGFSAGNGIIVAQYYGAENEKMVKKSASTGILLLLMMGIVATVVAIAISAPAYTYLMNVPKEILNQTLVYFRAYAVGLVFQFGYNIFSSILRAVGDSAATLYFLLISSVLNIVLDLLFVAVFHWGVLGAAVATDIAQAVSFIAAYIYMIKKYPIFHFGIRDFIWDTALAKKTVTVGLPIALQMVIVSLGFTFIQRAVNGFGKAMTASFTVGQRIEMYLNLPCNAFQTTLATYAGQNIGAGKIKNVKRGVRQTLLISLIMSLFISVLVWLFADNIISLFGLGSQAITYCRAHLRTIAFVNIVLGIYIPLFGVFQASNHGSACTVVATSALSVRVLVTYLLRYSAFLGYAIIWWNGLFGFGVGFIITWSYYLSGKWQKNSSIAED